MFCNKDGLRCNLKPEQRRADNAFASVYYPYSWQNCAEYEALYYRPKHSKRMEELYGFQITDRYYFTILDNNKRLMIKLSRFDDRGTGRLSGKCFTRKRPVPMLGGWRVEYFEYNPDLNEIVPADDGNGNYYENIFLSNLASDFGMDERFAGGSVKDEFKIQKINREYDRKTESFLEIQEQMGRKRAWSKSHAEDEKKRSKRIFDILEAGRNNRDAVAEEARKLCEDILRANGRIPKSMKERYEKFMQDHEPAYARNPKIWEFYDYCTKNAFQK